METEKDGIPTFYASTRAAWRHWLMEHHDSISSVWLIIYKKESQVPSVYYPEAVDEALCFGWIDSKPNKRDDKSYYQFFARRNPKSNWSQVNKDKVARLLEAGLMHTSGLAMIELAKKTGTWDALDAVDKLQEPEALMALFADNEKAFANWKNFPPSARRGILEWILNAKKPETRKSRMEETVRLAAQNLRAQQWKKP